LYNSSSILLILCVGFSVSATAEVTPAGQFATSLPVVVPAFHHIEPQLAFTYSSTPANGWLGAGWSLNGPSYIAQMSKGRGAPRFDGSDIFVLDGLELIPCQPQSQSPSCTTAVTAFGSSNGFYFTKTETFRRIMRITTENQNLWLVWDPNGRRRDYTLDADQTRWHLSSDIDTHGNQVAYSYQTIYGSNPSISDSYLSEIGYGDAGVNPGAHIRFYYDARPDTVTYGVGSRLDSKVKRLLTIDVSFGGKRVRSYALTYHSSRATAASLVDSIQQFGSDAIVNCGGAGDSCDSSLPQGKVVSGTSFPAQTLTYDESSGSGFQAMATSLDYNWPTFAGDFDGDGRTDYLEVKQEFETHLSNGDGTFRIVHSTPVPSWCQLNGTPLSLAWTCFPGGSSAIVGDFNGDGKTDFIALAQNINVFLSKGDGTFQVISSPPPAFCSGQPASMPPVRFRPHRKQ
jgi:hypothetical protein